MNIFFFDVETTSLDVCHGAIIQIAGILDIDGEVADTLNILVKPHENADIRQEALDVNKTSLEDLFENPARVSPKAAYQQVMDFCRYPKRVYQEHRIFASGYNAFTFDMPMLMHMGTRVGDQYSRKKFHWPVLDVAVLAADYLREQRSAMDSFSLASVAKMLGVEFEGMAHDAVFDTRVAREIYYKCRRGGVSC